jgi:hypothetical protein
LPPKWLRPSTRAGPTQFAWKQSATLLKNRTGSPGGRSRSRFSGPTIGALASIGQRVDSPAPLTRAPHRRVRVTPRRHDPGTRSRHHHHHGQGPRGSRWWWHWIHHHHRHHQPPPNRRIAEAAAADQARLPSPPARQPAQAWGKPAVSAADAAANAGSATTATTTSTATTTTTTVSPSWPLPSPTRRPSPKGSHPSWTRTNLR